MKNRTPFIHITRDPRIEANIGRPGERMPAMGDVVRVYGHEVVVVGTFRVLGIFSTLSYFAVSERALDDYFKIVAGEHIKGALDFTERMPVAYNVSPKRQNEPKDRNAFIYVLRPEREAKPEKLGEYDFGIPVEHKEALKGKCALGQLFGYGGTDYTLWHMVDGHFMSGDLSRPVIQITLYNSLPLNRWDLYKCVPLERLLFEPSPVNRTPGNRPGAGAPAAQPK